MHRTTQPGSCMSFRSACRLLGSSKYDLPPAPSPHVQSLMGRMESYPRSDGMESTSQRSASSYSPHSSQDGGLLGRFPKPAAPFRTPSATPSLDPGLINSLLRQQAERDQTILRLSDRVQTLEGDIAILKDANTELISGQKRLHNEMHELKEMHRLSSEQQNSVSRRLERSQEEILSYFQQHKTMTSSNTLGFHQNTLEPAIRVLSPFHRRRGTACRCIQSPHSNQCTPGNVHEDRGSASEDTANDPLFHETPKRAPQLSANRADSVSTLKCAPCDVSTGRTVRSASPAPSCTPSRTCSRPEVTYIRRAAIKLDLFDDDEEHVGGTPSLAQRLEQASGSGTTAQAPDIPTPQVADRMMIPLGAVQPNFILGASSLSHSGSKRRCAPMSWQSHQFARGQQARQQALVALRGGGVYMGDD